MLDMLVHSIHLFSLNGLFLLPLVTETLQDWIEPHLFLQHDRSNILLDRRSAAAKRAFCAFGFLISVKGLTPFLHLILR